MNLLGAILYDPSTAVNKVTTAAIAMTAIDTTNLRLAITVPAHGKVLFRLGACLHGATTFPSIMLGVMNGAGIVGRVAPLQVLGNTAVATALVAVVADFIATGLTPGALNADAAYGVETLVASTGLKYGGPNNTTANDAWGAFFFEAWDPIPLPTAAPGAANGVQICGANAATTYATLTSTGAFTVGGVSNISQTGDSFAVVKSAGTGDNAAIKAKTDLIPAAPASTTNITAGTITTVTNLTNAPTAGDLTATMKTSVTTAATAATPTAAAVTGAVGSVTGLTASDVGAIKTTIGVAGAGLTALGDSRMANLDAAVSSRSTYAGGAVASVSGSVGSVVGLTAANLDAAVSSRLATSGYTAPPTTVEIATAVLTTPMVESYRVNGQPGTLTQTQCAMIAHMGETAIVGTTKTLFKLDHVTPAETFTLNSATKPTAITRTT